MAIKLKVNGCRDILRNAKCHLMVELASSNAAFTWNQAEGGRHLVNGTGINKQSDEMEGQQNKTPMMMCCCRDVLFCTNNCLKYI